MSTFTSSFKTLPKASELRALVGDLPALQDMPFMSLPEGHHERSYLTAIYKTITEGHAKSSRPGQYTLMNDEVQYAIDISDNKIPLLTTRLMRPALFLKENIWFLSGSTDVAYLKANGVSIWDEWVIPETAVFEKTDKHDPREFANALRIKHPALYKAWRIYQDKHRIARPVMLDLQSFLQQNHKDLKDFPMERLVSGSIGEGAYGAQWRAWKDLRISNGRQAMSLEDRGTHRTIGDAKIPNSSGMLKISGASFDQIAEAVKLLRTSPDSRRIMVSAWNPGKLADMALPCCHYAFQLISHVNESTGERELTMKLNMRSSDALLGACANIMQYAALAHMFAHVTKHKATKLVFSPGDFHLYEDQLPFVREQLMRQPNVNVVPTLTFDESAGRIKEMHQFKHEHFVVGGYNHSDVHPAINYPVAV